MELFRKSPECRSLFSKSIPSLVERDLDTQYSEWINLLEQSHKEGVKIQGGDRLPGRMHIPSVNLEMLMLPIQSIISRVRSRMSERGACKEVMRE
jgi:hypothetical protein